MSAAKSVLDIPTAPAERRAWILFRLRAAGGSFRKLAAQQGCAPQSLHDAARGVPSLRMERAIAAAIGVSEKLLFPEHYAADGSRIPLVRSKTDKSVSPSERACNVKSVEAA